jgi:hypothetical protein
MKILLLSLFLFVAQVHAGEFRYHHMETTGLCDVVYAENGQATTVIFTKDSDAAALAILKALLAKLIYGTKGVENHEGARWEQRIMLIGDFTSKTKRTESRPNTASPEDYRDFRVTGVKLYFPLSRFEIAAGGNPILGPVIIETHFGFDSLFPHGITLKGKPIDLSKHATKRSDSK